jgi:hypothetical protein
MGRKVGFKRNNEDIFRVDSLVKSETLIATRRMQKDEGLIIALKWLFSEYPELRQCTHEYIADLLGMARETISRVYKNT